MSASGGYIIDDEAQQLPQQKSVDDQRQPLLSLTKRQESRLLIHLDEKLLNLERDDRKHAFISIPNLLERLTPLLHLILQIPPPDPWGQIRISYLLTLTNFIPIYITSLKLLQPRKSSSHPSPQKEVEETLRLLLHFLKILDKAWQTVLNGSAWLPPLDPDGIGSAVQVSFGSSMDQTQRIRLKSIIMAGRERLIAWARVYGDFGGTGLPGLEGEEGEFVDTGGWEGEIIGMMNGTLEMLAEYDENGS